MFNMISMHDKNDNGRFSSQISADLSDSHGSGSKRSTSTKLSQCEIDELIAEAQQQKSSPCTADMFYALMNGETTGEEKAAIKLDDDVFDLTPLKSSTPETGSRRNSASSGMSDITDITEDSTEKKHKRQQRRGRRGSVGSVGGESKGSAGDPPLSRKKPSDQARKVSEVVQDSFGAFGPEREVIGTPNPKDALFSSSRQGSGGQEFKAEYEDDDDPKGVSFGSVRIQYYERVIDVNPGTSSGVSLGIGWKFNKSRRLPIDEYELQRGGVRYKAQQLVLPRYIREDIAKEFGFSQKEIAEGTRQNLRYKNERKQTIDNLNLAGVEEKLESAQRKVVRLMTFASKRRP
jgi:hypothetical protein